MSLRGDREIIIRGGLGSCNSKEGLPGVRGDKRCKVYEEEVEVRRREEGGESESETETET